MNATNGSPSSMIHPAHNHNIMTTNYGMMNHNNNMNNENNVNMLKRKKEACIGSTSTTSTFAKPPPTLPKPKFILPQSSATNMILQRNLKAKSELNIATTGHSGEFTSSSSAASTSSTSSQEREKKIEQHIQQQQKQPIQQQHHQHGKAMMNSQSQGPIQAPIRNKLLENNSIVSSSQGYHSDTWESQSSRQSFDMEKPAPGTVGSIAKRYAQKIESKLAKTTILNNSSSKSNESTNIINTVASSENLISSNANSDDNESIPNDKIPQPVGNQYYNVQTKSILIQKPPTSSSSTVSTSSNSSSSSSGGGGVFSSGQATFSTTSSNCFSSSNMDSPNNHNEVASVNTVSTSKDENNINGTLVHTSVVNQGNCSTLNASSQSLGKIINESIELPIYYQPNEKLSTENSFNGDVCDSGTKNNRYSDLYESSYIKNFKLKN
jgi:hypothetical protein